MGLPILPIIKPKPFPRPWPRPWPLPEPEPVPPPPYYPIVDKQDSEFIRNGIVYNGVTGKPVYNIMTNTYYF